MSQSEAGFALQWEEEDLCAEREGPAARQTDKAALPTSTKSGSWYVASQGGQITGPFRARQIIRSWLQGRLDENVLCRQEAMPRWVRLVDTEPFASAMLRVMLNGDLIHVYCSCDNEIIMGRKFAGRKVRCKQCGEVIRVPSAVATASKAPVPAGGSSTPSTPAMDRSLTASPASREVLPDLTPSQRVLGPLGKSRAAAKRVVSLRRLDNMGFEGDTDPQAAATADKNVVQRLCPVCRTQIEKKAEKCPNCLTPLTAEAIAADAASKRKPLLPWLPRLCFSTRVKECVIAASVLAAGALIYAYCLEPVLRNKAVLQAEVDLTEDYLVDMPSPQAHIRVLRLTGEIPSFPYHRPEEVKVVGKLEIPQGPAVVFYAVGDGTFNLVTRRVSLTAVLDGRLYSYEESVPSALHLAARFGGVRNLALLLKDPWRNVNQTDEHRQTPLHVAAGVPNDHLNRVRLLLEPEYKADATIRDENGQTALLIARGAGNQWCAYELDPRWPNAKPAPPKTRPDED